jgi:hypothetical protein
MCNIIYCYSINIVESLQLHISNILNAFFVPRSTVSPHKMYTAVTINIKYTHTHMSTIHHTALYIAMVNYIEYSTLHTILLFPSRCNLEKLICTLSFLTTCFSPSWASSGVSSYAKTVKLYLYWISFPHFPCALMFYNFDVIVYQITL